MSEAGRKGGAKLEERRYGYQLGLNSLTSDHESL